MEPHPTVAAVIAQDLAGYGARRCFGLLGTANFKISHALVEAGVELISARHEGNAESMADAYAKSTGELTLLVLAGDVPAGNVRSNCYIEQAELDWHAEHFP